LERRLTAIFAADVVGYSRLMGNDEGQTLGRLKVLRSELVQPKIRDYKGRVVKLMGDGLLAEFPSVVAAVECALDIQTSMRGREAELPEEQRIRLRIGVNLGDIIVEGSDIYGDGVNVAARLEGLAQPGGLCVSSIVHESLGNRIDAKFADAGAVEVKNIDRPIHVYRWPAEQPGAAKTRDLVRALPDKPSIVVLPFDNLTDDPGQDYFADGMVEAITAALANIRSFFVIARNTAFTYKGKPIDVREVGRELGVGYTLEGSVQRAADRIRITAQLIETANGAHVWAKRFDGTLENVFELQDDITEQVAGALQPSIQLAEIERTRRKRPQDFGAYDFTMQALPHCWSLEKDETAIALEFLEQALAIDADYPLALSLTAWCHAQRSVYNWTDDVAGSKSKALKLAERAADLSGDDPLVLSVLGTAHSIVRNFGTARILLERAVSIDANSAWAWSRLGWLENYSGNCEAALAHFAKSQRLSPFDPMNFNTYVGMAHAYENAKQYNRAVEFYERALQERPHAVWIYRSYASGLVGAGRMEDAGKAFEKMMASYPDLTAEKIRQAMVFLPDFMDTMLGRLKLLGLPD
jgi:adenylate cyclase